jgi:hypothetical protein
MRLVRTVPGFWLLPELQSFYCPSCREAKTIEQPSIGESLANK